MQQKVVFPSGAVDYHFATGNTETVLQQQYGGKHLVYVTNERIAALYPQFFAGQPHLILPTGEHSKSLETIAYLVEQLLQLEATRHTTLVGVGGGVISDITGLLASVYMRGISFGYVSTSLLGMVDTAIGGKNGVNAGLHKNIIGTINQPSFIIFDTAFLNTLPDKEWSNGFAEIIKYACIFDRPLFDELSCHALTHYKNNPDAIEKVIQTCVAWKNKTVQEDEHEKGIRKLLNFGHTAGHAIETLYELPHGQAVAVGMVIACKLSEQETGLPSSVTEALKKTLAQYGLPTYVTIDTEKVMDVLRMDKKRKAGDIDYILLDEVGKATIKSLPLQKIKEALEQYENGC